MVAGKTVSTTRAATKEKASAPAGEAAPLSAAMQRSSAVIDRFLDGLWLEDGLAKNSLAAYRRDLTLFAAWLSEAQARDLAESRASDVQGYMLARHAGSKATSANRRLAVFRRFYRWGLRERLVAEDPTLKLRPARQAMRVPKTLTEGQVDALLAAPLVETPLGARDRAMLELMYASGLRVSELVELKLVNLSLADGVVRVMGKGSKERLVPFGDEARRWLESWLGGARAEVLEGRRSDALFVTVRAAAMSRQMFWNLVKKVRAGGGHPQSDVAAHLAPRVRDAPAQSRRRPARGAIAAGTRGHLDHDDLHARRARAPAPASRQAPSAWLISGARPRWSCRAHRNPSA